MGGLFTYSSDIPIYSAVGALPLRRSRKKSAVHRTGRIDIPPGAGYDVLLTESSDWTAGSYSATLLFPKYSPYAQTTFGLQLLLSQLSITLSCSGGEGYALFGPPTASSIRTRVKAAGAGPRLTSVDGLNAQFQGPIDASATLNGQTLFQYHIPIDGIPLVPQNASFADLTIQKSIPNQLTDNNLLQVNLSLPADGWVSCTLQTCPYSLGEGGVGTASGCYLQAIVQPGSDAASISDVTEVNEFPTTGNGDYFSIPRNGENNFYVRNWEMSFPGISDALTEIQSLQLNLLDGTGVPLQPQPSAGIWLGGPPVNVALNVVGNTITIDPTFYNVPSPFNTVPPPTHVLGYQLTATTSNGNTIQRTYTPYYGLWRMPPALLDPSRRYGVRDPGFDDWCSKGTYTWLLNQLSDPNSVVTRIDDVSGEHGRNLGHHLHAEGRSIDMYHFYTAPDAGCSNSGLANYLCLASHAYDLAQGISSADATLQNWVSATRDSLTKLANDNNVAFVIYAMGSLFSPPVTDGRSLQYGWARQLLICGTLPGTDANGNAFTLTVPSILPWDGGSCQEGARPTAPCQQLRFQADHNSHVHVELSASVDN